MTFLKLQYLSSKNWLSVFVGSASQATFDLLRDPDVSDALYTPL